jgi:uncharacterized protein
MNEQDQVVNSNIPAEPIKNTEEGEVIPVKVRQNVMESIKRAKQTVEDNSAILADYEKRLSDDQPSLAAKRKRLQVDVPPQHRRATPPVPANLTDNEKTWASLAHASVLITAAVGLSSAGVGSLLTLFIPLMIYFYFRGKSEYVTRHALQAFAAQVVGVVGFAVLISVAMTAWIVLLIISALLVLVLVGIILLPIVALGGLLVVASTVLLPLAMVVYGMIAAVEAYHGTNYSYPWIGDWVDDQLYGQPEIV